ncbi:MAG: hypothetical protein KF767_08665 [Bdellovibrionaceae bacterium]|nr:hypothetical protein [Pseudobdellovibrionaceae bacterium]
MADVNCQVNAPPADGENPGLTVGARFVLHCEGAWPAMDEKSLELRLDEADKHKLKLVAFKPSGAGAAELEVISYVVGPHELKAVQLTDAQNSVVLNNIKFQVASVQNPEAPMKEPYPPLGPMTFFPWMFAAAIAILVGVLVAGLLAGVFRKRRRVKLLNEVLDRSYQSAPAPEFYRELRALTRQYLFLTDPKASSDGAPLADILRALNSHFRVFLTRTYLIPAQRLTTSKTLAELAPVLGPESAALQKLGQVLRELDRALDNEARVRGADLEQISRLVREWVDLAQTLKAREA